MTTVDTQPNGTHRVHTGDLWRVGRYHVLFTTSAGREAHLVAVLKACEGVPPGFIVWVNVALYDAYLERLAQRYGPPQFLLSASQER